jgi:hypothetical protein
MKGQGTRYSMKTGQYRGLKQKGGRGKEDATRGVDKKHVLNWGNGAFFEQR